MQAAPDLIVFVSCADNNINLLAAKNKSSQTSTSTNSSSSGSVPDQQHPLQRRTRHSHPGRIGPDVREKNDIAWFGLDLAPASLIQSETAKWASVVKESGAKLD